VQRNRWGWPELRLEALVENPDLVPLPFGLGYHPYFRLTHSPVSGLPEGKVRATAQSYWQLEDSLPTGGTRAVDSARDLRKARPIADVQLDDLLTDLAPDNTMREDGFCFRGLVRDLINVLVGTSEEFREFVVFTPPHRQAICLEPYTCTTDAINLQQRGVNAGLLVLPPGEKWTGTVALLGMP
jgi:aldose 1-epimerase